MMFSTPPPLPAVYTKYIHNLSLTTGLMSHLNKS